MPLTISSHPLSDHDFQTADALLASAFGGSTNRIFDLQLYSQVQPDGWVLAWQDEKLAGMVGAVNYGLFAHVGYMAVHPEAQRQGIGLALMQSLLEGLERQKVPLVTLDASAAGQPLYEKLGFVAYDETLTFHRQGKFQPCAQHPRARAISPRDLDELIEFDRGFFGAERGKVLRAYWEALPGRAFLLRNERDQISGYLFAQKSRIGPWVARLPQEAEVLFRAALSLPYDDSVSVVAPAKNRDAIHMLKRYEFEQGRANRHMARGLGSLPGQREQVYAQTSLSMG
ncbi:MAG: GNAT family N-acetyltransferase [Chloroflexi bacterium]|nr:MAG: GNAT family N-acetyltransferase [Chloroflexota bacterium]